MHVTATPNLISYVEYCIAALQESMDYLEAIEKELKSLTELALTFKADGILYTYYITCILTP